MPLPDPTRWVGQRIALATEPTRTGRIIGADTRAGQWTYTVSWDATGPDRDSLFNYRRYTESELTPLATAPARVAQPPVEQLSLPSLDTEEMCK